MFKDYLDRAGVNDSRFKENLPGRDWINGFIERHRLTKRLADNVKPARAEVTRASVFEYFNELEKTVQNVPATHIYNFDETNVTDDPGAKTVVCRRGMKRIERKIQHSKTCISIMYCGSAAGIFLPRMVVYRAQNCYVEWTTGGPKESVYDATKSGWFDSRCFEKWFSDVFLKSVRNQQGTKVVIADNLASHFSPSVIQASLDNDIRFVCLLPNSTHLLQPLDLAVFLSLKLEWRSVLKVWHRESRVKGSIPKNQFPGLLKKLNDRLKPANLISGFAAVGIYPLNREAVLKRLPDTNRDVGDGQVVSELFNDAIVSILSKHCGNDSKKVMKRGRKIVPGRCDAVEPCRQS